MPRVFTGQAPARATRHSGANATEALTSNTTYDRKWARFLLEKEQNPPAKPAGKVKAAPALRSDSSVTPGGDTALLQLASSARDTLRSAETHIEEANEAVVQDMQGEDTRAEAGGLEAESTGTPDEDQKKGEDPVEGEIDEAVPMDDVDVECMDGDVVSTTRPSTPEEEEDEEDDEVEEEEEREEEGEEGGRDEDDDEPPVAKRVATVTAKKTKPIPDKKTLGKKKAMLKLAAPIGKNRAAQLVLYSATAKTDRRPILHVYDAINDTNDLSSRVVKRCAWVRHAPASLLGKMFTPNQAVCALRDALNPGAVKGNSGVNMKVALCVNEQGRPQLLKTVMAEKKLASYIISS